MLTGGLEFGSLGGEPDRASRCWCCDEALVFPGVATCQNCGASLMGQSRRDHDRARWAHPDSAPGLNEPQPQADSAGAVPAVSWTDADFERISQTAGAPRDDSRGEAGGATPEALAARGDADFERISQAAAPASNFRMDEWLERGIYPGSRPDRRVVAGGPVRSALVWGFIVVALLAAAAVIGRMTGWWEPLAIADHESPPIVMGSATPTSHGGSRADQIGPITGRSRLGFQEAGVEPAAAHTLRGSYSKEPA